MAAFAGNTLPDGWLACDGTAVSRTTYTNLFSKIGTTYGAGDDSATFNLPDLTDKFIQGNGTPGTVKTAGLPNITGSVNSDYIISNSYSGAFAYTDVGTSRYGSTTTTWHNGIGFDASKSNSIYGNSTTVQPPALTMRFAIFAGYSTLHRWIRTA